jgi:hypothetical protein
MRRSKDDDLGGSGMGKQQMGNSSSEFMKRCGSEPSTVGIPAAKKGGRMGYPWLGNRRTFYTLKWDTHFSENAMFDCQRVFNKIPSNKYGEGYQPVVIGEVIYGFAGF